MGFDPRLFIRVPAFELPNKEFFPVKIIHPSKKYIQYIYIYWCFTFFLLLVNAKETKRWNRKEERAKSGPVTIQSQVDV